VAHWGAVAPKEKRKNKHIIIKGNFHPVTGHEDQDGERRYSSNLSLTLALVGSGWSTPRPGCLTPGKGTWYPLCRRYGPRARLEVDTGI
jgi:hypothetical protein